MKRSIIILVATVSSLAFLSCSEEKKLLRKASVAVDACDYAEAVKNYDKILLKDSATFSGNAGKGVVLSEYMGKYEEAIPYLERALKRSPEKNVTKINSDLGKSYHFIGNYPRALYYYGKVMEKNKEENEDYDYYLSKRIADCRYALDHPEVNAADQQSVTNIGNTINTPMPDYDPVYVNGKLIFTSKRQDTPKERLNGIDGRYFESMYVANMDSNNVSTPRRYTFPDLGTDSRFKKGNESVLSASSDGKTLYVFRRGQVFEADLNDPNKTPKQMPHNINFTDFQSGAFISKDGKTMLFSSDSPNGRGGTDIYRSDRDEEGNWSPPMALYALNTVYNEDSPCLTEDGNTLYFCSNGHPGYGGYDIYKSVFVNGEWSNPVNIGQPINTPGDETHFTLLPNSTIGYYASNRQGGYGDMDIYQVHYIGEEAPECNDFDTLFVINAEQKADDPKTHVLTALVPEQYKGRVKSIQWQINGEPLSAVGDKIEHRFGAGDTYRVYAKAIVYCENCTKAIAICNEKDVVVGEIESPLVSNDAGPKPEPDVPKNEMTGTTIIMGKLSSEQLIDLGWKITPAYFDYNGTVLRTETKELLDNNVKVLKQNPELTVIVNGYADSRGTTEYNLHLSRQRANSVKQYFIQKGISRNRISIVGYGESKVDNGCTDGVACEEAQHQHNRKVEFNVSNNQKSITGLFR